MCSAPKAPKMPEYDPLPQPEPLPPLPQITAPVDERTDEEKRRDLVKESMPMPRQQTYMPVEAPTASYSAPPIAPPAPLITPETRQAPPPQLTNSTDDSGIVKRRKSKRQELQQASGGTDALRIKLNKSSGIGGAKKGTGSSGLNIPK